MKKRIIGHLGDIGIPEYDGAVVFERPDGSVYVEYVDLDEESGTGQVGQFEVPEPTQWRSEWWAKQLPGAAKASGRTTKALERDLNSQDPFKRAAALYHDVKGYVSLCDDEQTLTRDELKRRFRG